MNKLGLHIIDGYSGPLGKPRLVKLLDPSVEYVAQVRQTVGTACIIIVRWYQASQPLDNPAARAQQFVARYQSEMLAMRQTGANIAFEGYNEVPDDQAGAYCVFEVERLRSMHALGLRSVVGNFSVGTPDFPVWETYRSMIHALEAGDWLGLHEYWVDTADLSNPYHVGRWRKVSMLASVPIIVTECGRDVVEGRGQPGWRKTCDAATFLVDLAKYNALLEQFSNVLGAVVFTVGGHGWEAFDAAPVWPQVVASYTGTPWSDPSYATPPTTTPGTVYGPDPAVKYWHSDRHGYKPEWIIVHDTEGPGPAALSWWSNPNNPYKSSAHDLVDSEGVIWHCVPYDKAAHHCGGSTIPGVPTGSIDGTSIVNLVSIGIELEYPAAPASPAWPEAQVAAAARLVAGMAKRYSIPRDHILRHRDVDPQNRSDPRNFDWEGFLDRVFGTGEVDVEDQILKAAWSAMQVPYNSLAAFPRAARTNDLGAPLLPERDIIIGGVTYRYQPFARGIVYARVGDWGNCKVLKW